MVNEFLTQFWPITVEILSPLSADILYLCSESLLGGWDLLHSSSLLSDSLVRLLSRECHCPENLDENAAIFYFTSSKRHEYHTDDKNQICVPKRIDKHLHDTTYKKSGRRKSRWAMGRKRTKKTYRHECEGDYMQHDTNRCQPTPRSWGSVRHRKEEFGRWWIRRWVN